MNKLDPKTDGATANIVEQNIDKLRELFPDAFTEGSDEHGLRWKVDIDALGEIIGQYVEDRPERYSFTWNGKSRARRIAQTPSTGTLRPCPEESVNWDTTKNLFIEGDNLEVLKLLQKSYHRKVKMIYIDPPYNTGKEFIYPDKFADNLGTYLRYTGQIDDEGLKLSANAETGGRYHTNWLSMMLPRLKLARNLLKDDGVIFISIDDNEVANLRKLCDDVFGEENFIGVISVNSTPNARDYGHIGKMHEYVLFYAKNIEETETFLIPEPTKIFKFSDERGEFNVHPLYNSNVAFTPKNRPNLYYPFYLYPDRQIDNNFFQIDVVNRGNAVEIYPPESQKGDAQFVWRWGKEKASGELNAEIIGYKTTSGEYRIVQKMRHSSKLIRSLLIDKKYSTRKGTAEVEQLFGKKLFPFPKPVSLLRDLLISSLNPNELVIDLFAGSCTTAHAEFSLNSEDGGSRKFIMVQLPESLDDQTEAGKNALDAGYSTIADIGKERIRRVIKKIEGEQAEKAKEAKERLPGTAEDVPELDLGFKVFKLDASNIKPWDADFDNLEKAIADSIENIKFDRSEEDVLYELLLKYGLDLAVPIEERKIDGKTVYIIGAGALIVCLADKISLDVVEGIAALKEELKPEIMRVVFKDAGFADDVVKTNTVQILKQAEIDDVKSL